MISSNYIILGMFSGIMGFGFSFIIRAGSTGGSSSIMSQNPQIYNSVVSSHALIIIFFMLLPSLLGGFGNSFFPTMIGAHDISYPRVNKLSYELLPWALLILCLSLFLGGAGAGWTLYPPLSTLGSPGIATDAVFIVLHIAGASSIAGGCNFISTTGIRTNPSTNGNLHPFIWTILVTVFLLLLSLPILAGGVTIAIFDRNFNTLFFESEGGGNPVLYQHLFWFFGHPEVYVLILPAFGLVSINVQIIGNRNEIFSPRGILLAVGAIGGIGCLVWAHHIFSVGIDIDSRAYYSIATIVIAIPTGVNVFSWLLTFLSSGHTTGVLINPRFFWLLNLRHVANIDFNENDDVPSDIFLCNSNPNQMQLNKLSQILLPITPYFNNYHWRFVFNNVPFELVEDTEDLSFNNTVINRNNHRSLSSWWVAGFLFIFTVGGITGLILANVPIDLPLHDTYFVVAHFHYVLSIGATFGLFAGFYGFFSFLTGLVHHNLIGNIFFNIFFIGANTTFLPIHFAGLQGCPRRYVELASQFNNYFSISNTGFCFIIVSVTNMAWGLIESQTSFRISLYQTTQISTSLFEPNIQASLPNNFNRLTKYLI